ncbi:hypothetical protein [Brenneria izadpanahii]
MLNGSLKPWDHAAGRLIHQEAENIPRYLTARRTRWDCAKGYLPLAANQPRWNRLVKLVFNG